MKINSTQLFSLSTVIDFTLYYYNKLILSKISLT